MIQREKPQAAYAVVSRGNFRRCNSVSSLATKSGCTMKPTRRSETARLQMKIIDGDWSEGDLLIAANTNKFPVMDTMMRNATIEQLIMTVVLTLEARFPSPLALSLV